MNVPRLGPWHECCTSAGPDWPGSRGLQAEAADSAEMGRFASADLTRRQVLNFRLESAPT